MSLPAVASLSPETTRLTELEAVIEGGIRTFSAVGAALLEIRDQRLYRDTHATFETYLRDRWDISRSYAHRTMAAAEVVAMLPVGNTPTNESVARELVPLIDEPEAMREAWTEAVEQSPGEPTAAIVREVVARTQGRTAPLMTSDSDEWFTPRDVIARVLRAFPVIDLDPCAERATVKNVPATTHLTIDDDGLEYGWRGRVFANPPYSRVQAFAEKVALEAGNIDEAIVLVPARTETRWWRVIPASVVCFFDGRLKFVDPTGQRDGAATFPSAALYVGPDPSRFETAFSDVGLLYRRVER